MNTLHTSLSADESTTGLVPKEEFVKKAENEQRVKKNVWKSSITVVSQFFCEDCQKTFSSYIPYLQHFQSRTHYKRLRKLRDFEEVYPHLIAQGALTPKIGIPEVKDIQMDQLAIQDISSVNQKDKFYSERKKVTKLEDVGQDDDIKLNEPSKLFVENSTDHTEDELEVVCAEELEHSIGSTCTDEIAEFVKIEDDPPDIKAQELLGDHLSDSTDSSSIEVLYKEEILPLNDQGDNKEKEWFFLKWFHTQECNH
ncbi:uncharacterized protein LOC106458118 isoform X2 [Limulus polyphemus]|nr:uncharacterized protein LOC106458118 isoform X2 [Limulus polyphemus]XP_022239958.1 uncharacterized protein LOC106458118 isoform X2 [Limulus polyphemus]XP_022239959.1 uncharacterized protein LOC106458118 isoform X2 [Limulus polyphemus]XP_022239960.1 uncharacterized protein LOC106458118 isoform X2 [Limulus polyphemus]XP_022239961.1 uncharacterized protein LOC106458118 isoform X2 [Limulus polyphemus]